jgi:hypothetical protein
MMVPIIIRPRALACKQRFFRELGDTAMTQQRSSRIGSNTILRIESLESRRLLAVTPFSLEDVNPTSQTFGQAVSPADYAGQTSAWYFAHST